MATRTFWQNNESHSGSNRFLAANARSGAALDIYWPQSNHRTADVGAVVTHNRRERKQPE